MPNAYVIRKYTSLLVGPVLTTMLFMLGNLWGNFWWGMILMMSGLLLSLIIGTLLLRTPFRLMEEGKGILSISLDSSGVMQPFITSVKQPYIRGKVEGKRIEDVFNRNTVFTLKPPIPTKQPAQISKEGSIKIDLTNEDYNAGRFAMFHYPCLIWNNQVKSFITKDFLSGLEKDIFAEHGILYLNHQVRSLNTSILAFARYYVDLHNQEPWYKSKWIGIIVIVFIGILLFLFGPSLLSGLKGMMGTAQSGVSNAVTNIGGAVHPITPGG